MFAKPEIGFDVQRYRRDFPILAEKIHDHPLVYLDTAASAQTPKAVIDEIRDFYERRYANIHRGVHSLSVEATRAYESAREAVRQFMGAKRADEIIFTRGTTEAINLVAQTFAKARLEAGDDIVVSVMEHHSNIVPWQMVCEEKKARLKVIPIDERGELCLDRLETLISSRTKLLAVTHMSNVLGTINPLETIIECAHKHGVPVLIDGAQAVPHRRVDVQALDCEFYAFSGHKLYGPTGIGALYGKSSLLSTMPPYQGGGAMIKEVCFERTTYGDPPERFEAGTPNISGALGLAAAIRYLETIGLDEIAAYEERLLAYALKQLATLSDVRVFGAARDRGAVVSFNVGHIHPEDIGVLLDQMGIAIRTGHHCAQPLMKQFEIVGTARASFALYNTVDEIDLFVKGLKKIIDIFADCPLTA